MPNTFVHLGVQSVSTKALFREADFKWIALGCIIPDVPWILQRVIHAVNTGVDLIDLLQYVIVQSSLFFCLFLCGAIALVTASPARIFLILAGNTVLHLLLDAMQIKWANGVHFFAPFSWHLTNFNLLWPEHGITYAFTAAGLAALVYFGAKDWRKKVVLTPGPMKYAVAVVLMASYFILPFWFRFGPEQANNHYIGTLRNVEQRPGQYLELDRGWFQSSDNTVLTFSGERIHVTGDHPSQDAIMSVKGNFTDTNTIHISAFHVHNPLRNVSSMAALAGVLFIWLTALMKKRITVQRNK